MVEVYTCRITKNILRIFLAQSITAHIGTLLIFSPMQDDKLSYDEVLGQFDVVVDSPLTDYGHAVHEEL